MDATATSWMGLIEEFEGFSATAYPDPLHGWGVPTIGFGTTRYADGRKVKQGDTITREQAVAEVQAHVLQIVLPALERIPGWGKMHQRQRAALISFAYNMGEDFYGSPRCETITKRLRDGQWGDMRAVLVMYCNPNTSAEEGLRRRRNREADEWEAGLKALAAPAQPTAASAQPVPARVPGPFAPGKIQDFFRWYDVKNPHHVAAVGMLEKAMADSGLLRDDAPWVQEWRWRPPPPITQAPPSPAKPSLVAEIRLQVPYYSQRDSQVGEQWSRSCYSSTNAMFLDFLKPAALPDGANADDVYLKRVLQYGDTTDAWAQVQALLSFGVKARLRQDLDWEDLDYRLERGVPVPVGILHKGPVSAPSGGGHWICVVGRTADKSAYIVHDPFGDLDLVNGGYANVPGRFLTYSKKNLGPRWMDKGPHTGWGIIIA